MTPEFRISGTRETEGGTGVSDALVAKAGRVLGRIADVPEVIRERAEAARTEDKRWNLAERADQPRRSDRKRRRPIGRGIGIAGRSTRGRLAAKEFGNRSRFVLPVEVPGIPTGPVTDGHGIPLASASPYSPTR